MGDAIGDSLERIMPAELTPASERRPLQPSDDAEPSEGLKTAGEVNVSEDLMIVGDLEPLEVEVQSSEPQRAHRPSSASKFAQGMIATAKVRYGILSRWVEGWAEKWGSMRLDRLVARRGRMNQSMRNTPEKMHRAARKRETSRAVQETSADV
jgi:hypothetical protein